MIVRKTQCNTCIYRPDSPLDIEKLEDECKDRHGFFVDYRVCHKHEDGSGVCCRGFWNEHRDDATPTQIAHRLGLVEFTNNKDRRKGF